jgi:signal transduction histidine kinase
LVHVDVRLDDAGGCIIEVVDSGKGLSPDALEEALDPLNLSDDPTRDVAMAIGYGLVQRLVNIHDGDMHVTSDPGVGSRVLVTWPKQKVRLAPLDISEQDAG